MLTLCFISISVGWLAAWYCKDLYEDYPKQNKTKNTNYKSELFKHNKFNN